MANKFSKLKQLAAAAAMLSASAGIAWASCGETALLVAEQSSAAAGSLANYLAQQAAALVALDTTDSSRLVGSIAVATKQVQATTDAMAAATVQAAKAQAQAMSDIAESELKAKLKEDFDSNGGLPCDDTDSTLAMAQAEKTVESGLGSRIRQEVDVIGKYADVGAVLDQRRKDHDALFCTQTEVDIGICSKLGAVPGGDQNAALLFSADTSPEIIKAKNAYINNLIGRPDPKIDPRTADKVETDAYVQAKKQKDAFLSIAAYSLKSIQSESEQFDPVMNERVGQYFGTPAAEQWAANQASQATRGVLVDLVKMQGFNLKIAERRLKQSLRMEANLAALVELERKSTLGADVEMAAKLAAGATGSTRAEQP